MSITVNAGAESGAAFPVQIERGLEYGSAEGLRLTADYYRPETGRKVPVVIAIHGGAWKLGTAQFYQYWGPYLAARGIALLAIDYRLVSGPENRYPAAVDDVREAIRFVRAEAARLGIDPERIGLIGDSAGAHLAALVALTDEPAAGIKAVVSVYGVYDLVAQWQHDLSVRPHDQIAEAFIGRSPLDDRMAHIQASPLTHVTRKANRTAFMVAWGTADDVVDWASQSQPFVTALKQAGFFVRTLAITDAPHFWMSDPLDDVYGYPIRLAPSLMRFLGERL